MSSKIYIKKTIEELNSLLESVLTGKTAFENENSQYEKLRKRILALRPILGIAPEFLNCENLWSFWHSHIKGKLPDYESRRHFLRENFKEHYDGLLNNNLAIPFEQVLILRDLAVHDVIGEGGFGTVYKADHIVLDEFRAVKKLTPLFANEEAEIIALKRFTREANILSKLNHPNIVKVYDAGLAGEYPYIVMDFINGKSLDKWISENGVFSMQMALIIMDQILSAMAAAHKLGIIHRDIKPSNVMWDGNKATILDFGAGQWLEKAISTRITTAPIGTYGYIAVELFENPTLLNRNLDCYSLGVLFHYILSGHIPNVGSPSYYLEEKNINAELISFIMRAMSPPDTRYIDGGEMFDALESIGNNI